MFWNPDAAKISHGIRFAQHGEEDDSDIHFLCHQMIGTQVCHLSYRGRAFIRHGFPLIVLEQLASDMRTGMRHEYLGVRSGTRATPTGIIVL